MDRQINHKTMRLIIGLIAVLLAPMVMLLANAEQPLTSISISYWTDAQDIFVGSLVAVGFFLSAYNGRSETIDWEFCLSKAACVFAIVVALFPTDGFSNKDIPPAWISTVSKIFRLEPTQIHYSAAVLLFVCLIAMIWFFPNRAACKGKPIRALIYRVIACSMVIGIVGIFILGELIFDWDNTVLLIEFFGLTLFGAGWFLAGTYKTENGQSYKKEAVQT